MKYPKTAEAIALCEAIAPKMTEEIHPEYMRLNMLPELSEIKYAEDEIEFAHEDGEPDWWIAQLEEKLAKQIAYFKEIFELTAEIKNADEALAALEAKAYATETETVETVETATVETATETVETVEIATVETATETVKSGCKVAYAIAEPVGTITLKRAGQRTLFRGQRGGLYYLTTSGKRCYVKANDTRINH